MKYLKIMADGTDEHGRPRDDCMLEVETDEDMVVLVYRESDYERTRRYSADAEAKAEFADLEPLACLWHKRKSGSATIGASRLPLRLAIAQMDEECEQLGVPDNAPHKERIAALMKDWAWEHHTDNLKKWLDMGVRFVRHPARQGTLRW